MPKGKAADNREKRSTELKATIDALKHEIASIAEDSMRWKQLRRVLAVYRKELRELKKWRSIKSAIKAAKLAKLSAGETLESVRRREQSRRMKEERSSYYQLQRGIKEVVSQDESRGPVVVLDDLARAEYQKQLKIKLIELGILAPDGTPIVPVQALRNPVEPEPVKHFEAPQYEKPTRMESVQRRIARKAQVNYVAEDAEMRKVFREEEKAAKKALEGGVEGESENILTINPLCYVVDEGE